MQGGKRGILAIDDDDTIRRFLEIHLTKAGYRVMLSSGGNAVFSRLDAIDYDLVICDINMPEVNGPRVLEYVQGKSANIPVIMLTGVIDVAMAVEIMKLGAFDYLIKPILKENLLRTVHKALSNKDVMAENIRLEEENRQYRLFLEEKVKERTEELARKNEELNSAYAELKKMNFQFAIVLAETIEAKDIMTGGHCARIRAMSLNMGRFLGLSAEDLEMLEYASLMHDLGKVGISETILNKKDKLTSDEYEIMKQHAPLGEKILGRIKGFKPLAEIIGGHHEMYDGTGYPRGLKGDGIPLITRIISLVDTFDAIHADRPYRLGRPLEEVLSELGRVAGTQLDPGLVEVFIENRLYELGVNGGGQVQQVEDDLAHAGRKGGGSRD